MKKTTINFANNETSARFKDIMNALKPLGKRALYDVPVDLLAIDETYQTQARTNRNGDIAKLAKNWDEDKLEPITVVPHCEEGKFYVVNGYGRWKASQMQSPKYEYLCATVLLGAAELASVERRKFESELFAFQNREVSKLKPTQVHGALKNLENPAVLMLEEFQNEFKFTYSTVKGNAPEGVLGSYSTILEIAKSKGRDCLDYIFRICRDSAFNRKSNGYASYVLRTLSDIWTLYPECRNETKTFFSTTLRKIDPISFKSQAVTQYPILDSRTACSVYAEDMIVKHIDVEHKRYFEGSKVKKIA